MSMTAGWDRPSIRSVRRSETPPKETLTGRVSRRSKPVTTRSKPFYEVSQTGLRSRAGRLLGQLDEAGLETAELASASTAGPSLHPYPLPDAYAEGSPHEPVFTTKMTAPLRRRKMQRLTSSAGWKALIRVRKREREGLVEEARGYAARLRSDFPQARVFLYGSVAKGDFNLHSDIDLLVVADLPEPPLSGPRFSTATFRDAKNLKG